MKPLFKKLILFATALFTFSALSAVGASTYEMELNAKKVGFPIQSTMYGIFFEDINFGADGGLYAELIKNRSFEFTQPFMGWTPFGNIQILDKAPCFERNPHYARLSNHGELTRTGLDNEGFKGIGFKKGETYNFSTYVRSESDKALKLRIELIDSQNDIVASKEIDITGKDWHKVSETLKPSVDDLHGRIRVILVNQGIMDMDHISLFPAKTWKDRPAGLRADLAQALNDLKPGVFRFPGGCIVEGTTLATRYQWKNTIGQVENRPININRWNYTFPHKFFPDYYQSYGLGFFEFFQLSEDIGSEPLPVLSCGLSCQFEGNQCVALDSLAPYVQDALDLIEFANGDVTTVWGKKRAEMGHPAPFHLKMMAIGNEQWGTVYPERLKLFVSALRKQHPEIKIIGSAGPSPDGDKFDTAWKEMKTIKTDLVDEHYYCSPEWFFSNAKRYDNYDRKGPKVFAGEYASHDKTAKKDNNFLSALSEAAFMTGLERNADMVQLATYAPLFAHVDAWQWNPDLIWFDNVSIVKTPNYYVQQMYGLNKGTNILPLTLNKETITGQEKLYGTACFDSKNSEIIVKIVNSDTEAKTIKVKITNYKKQLTTGDVTLLQADDLKVKNEIAHPDNIVPQKSTIEIKDNVIEFTAKKQSFYVIRVR